MAPRPEVIESLCNASNAAMTEVAEAMKVTPSELISAHFNLCRRAARMILEHSKGMDQVHNRSMIIDTLTLLCTEVEGTVN
jgi:hypothetical protein